VRKIGKREASQLERKVKLETAIHVKGMVDALSSFTGFRDGRKAHNNAHRRIYDTFREHKRAIYALYPDNQKKAQAIVRFALIQSGWANRG
jgi:hypothetical protein